MTENATPAKHKPGHDWRSEVNWPYFRRLIALHGLFWAFNAGLVVLFLADMLVGPIRTLLGTLGYLAWGALLMLSFRVVAGARNVPRPRRRAATHMVSLPTFLILIAFVASLVAYIPFLIQIDLDTIWLL